MQIQAQRGGGGHASAGGHGGFSGHAEFAGSLAAVDLSAECELVPVLHRDLSRQDLLFVGLCFPVDSKLARIQARTVSSFPCLRPLTRRFRLRTYATDTEIALDTAMVSAMVTAIPTSAVESILIGGGIPTHPTIKISKTRSDLAEEMNQQSLEEQQMRNQADQDAYA